MIKPSLLFKVNARTGDLGAAYVVKTLVVMRKKPTLADYAVDPFALPEELTASSLKRRLPSAIAVVFVT
jgi:hypothetical protein